MNARHWIAVSVVLSMAALALAEDGKDRGKGIAWYGTWDRGLKVAGDTGRPILLVAAAPQCHGISGIW